MILMNEALSFLSTGPPICPGVGIQMHVIPTTATSKYATVLSFCYCLSQ